MGDSTQEERGYEALEAFEALVCFECKSLEKNIQLNIISIVKKLREETTHINSGCFHYYLHPIIKTTLVT